MLTSSSTFSPRILLALNANPREFRAKQQNVPESETHKTETEERLVGEAVRHQRSQVRHEQTPDNEQTTDTMTAKERPAQKAHKSSSRNVPTIGKQSTAERERERESIKLAAGDNGLSFCHILYQFSIRSSKLFVKESGMKWEVMTTSKMSPSVVHKRATALRLTTGIALGRNCNR